jgi:5,10-methylenetetrahydromethanopterin reductase
MRREIHASIALECDKPHETYQHIASLMDDSGFYSLQLYEHTPYRPAWAIIFSLNVRSLKTGPVTVPARLYRPALLARYLAYLQSRPGGAVLGISRGAYMGGERAEIGEVVETVEKVVEHLKMISWAPSFTPEIYVGTSGPKLVKTAASSPHVRAIVVDNLANPRYAAMVRSWMDEAGRPDMPLIARPFTSISDDPRKAADHVLGELRKYLPDLVGPSPMLEAAGLTLESLSAIDDEVGGRLLENFAVYGSVEDVLDKLAKLVKAGVSHICLGHPLGADPVKAVQLIRDKILPYIKDETHT